MRFLCLHGRGTNSDIFEAQLAALCSRISPIHTFDFLDAQFECPPAPGISELAPPPYLTWYPQYGTQDIEAVHVFLSTVIEEDGPYDGIIGFSEGAALAASFVLSDEHMRRTRGGKRAFELAVFFNSVMLFSPSEDIGVDITAEVQRQEESLCKFLQGIESMSSMSDTGSDEEEQVSESSSETSFEILQRRVGCNSKVFGFPVDYNALQISIPTLHFIGREDQFAEHGRHLVKLCDPDTAQVMVFEGSHELPRTRESLDKGAELLQLAITLASTYT